MYLYLISRKNLNVLQQNFYNENNRYIKWGNKNLKKVFGLDIIAMLINLINVFIRIKYILLFNCLYLLLYVHKKNILKKEQIKIPFKITNRIKRIVFTLILLYLVPLIFYKNIFILIFTYSFLISVNYYMIFLSNVINYPIEKIVFLYYKNKAKKKLKRFNNLKIVGITGSYGKTSTKNILNDILSVKYNSVTTPKNYNTLYGLIITINKYLNKFNDIFIAEMGAFKKGRIKKLCNLVKPKYGIITKIGESHLDSFKTINNIRNTKFELIEYLPKNGIGILNMDDKEQVKFNIKNKVKIIWIGIDSNNADLVANNILISKNGMSFDVIFKKENIIKSFKTRLLGIPNIYNILSSIAFARYIMNMDIDDIILGVKRIKPIPHRLEIKNFNNYTIIDDAYNSNPIGSKMALDVLKLMDGEKIVVTPGMIELKDKEYEFNKEFGKYISEVADYVILVGNKQTKAIKYGLISNNFNKDKILTTNNVKEAFIIIDKVKNNNKHTYILLENDLPDIFNE